MSEISEEDFLKEAGSLDSQELGELLWELDKEHYDEKPVDIDTFIDDPTFLGDIWDEQYYPWWREKLNELYPNPFYSPCYEVICDLPIGAGKTTAANTSIAYDIYRTLCLKNPNDYYGIKPRGLMIVWGVISAAKALAGDVNWASLETMLDHSPWFKEKCPLAPDPDKRIDTKTSTVYLSKNLGLVIGSTANHILSKAVFGGLVDEANFQKIKSGQASTTYMAMLNRMVSRFIQMKGAMPGKLWLMSSPKFSTDFLSAHIEETKKSQRTMVISNTPIWEIMAHKTELFDGATFRVFVGDDTRDPTIVDDKFKIMEVDPKNVVDVPMVYHESFMKNPLDAIRDIIGRAHQSSMALFKQIGKITVVSSLPHRFSMEIISLDFRNTAERLADYADMMYFEKPIYKEYVRYLHVDLGITNDKAGIGSVFAVPEKTTLAKEIVKIEELQDVNIEDTINFNQRVRTSTMMDRMYYADFVISIKAKPGEEIPLYKIRAFIVHLRNIGYPIQEVSFDQFQSRDMRQQLELQGIKTKHLSIDGEKNREPYLAFCQAVNNERILLPKHALLNRELREIRDNGLVVDHPPKGSKDASDGVVGGYWNCLNSKIVTRFNIPSEDQDPFDNLTTIGMLKSGMEKAKINELTKYW